MNATASLPASRDTATILVDCLCSAQTNHLLQFTLVSQRTLDHAKEALIRYVRAAENAR